MSNIADMMKKHLRMKMLEKFEVTTNRDNMPKVKIRTAEEERERENLLKSDLQIELDESKKRISDLLQSMDDNN